MSRVKSDINLYQKNISINDRTQAVSDVLFFSIGEGAIVIDERGNISRVNQIALDILGYSADDLIGKWYPDMFIAEDENGNVIPNMELPAVEAFLSGKPVFKRIYFRKKNQERVALALTVSPVILDDKPVGTIELFRDITEELQLERAKDEFISIASHQLRTPATIVKQYLGMLVDGFVKSKTEQKKLLKVAYKHNDRQLDIINDLLKVANADANKIKPYRKDTDLVNLLRSVVASQKVDYTKKRIKLIFKSEVSTLTRSIDPLHLQMVFENLINNAKKYSPEGSTVIVELALSAKSIIIRVKDEGIGIDKKDIPKLFKKFSRIENVNNTIDGTGLGLYWAKKLVELHRGEINVSSEWGLGSTFSVILPLGKNK